jgi:hypothetical protein
MIINKTVKANTVTGSLASHPSHKTDNNSLIIYYIFRSRTKATEFSFLVFIDLLAELNSQEPISELAQIQNNNKAQKQIT